MGFTVLFVRYIKHDTKHLRRNVLDPSLTFLPNTEHIKNKYWVESRWNDVYMTMMKVIQPRNGLLSWKTFAMTWCYKATLGVNRILSMVCIFNTSYISSIKHARPSKFDSFVCLWCITYLLLFTKLSFWRHTISPRSLKLQPNEKLCILNFLMKSTFLTFFANFPTCFLQNDAFMTSTKLERNGMAEIMWRYIMFW